MGVTDSKLEFAPDLATGPLIEHLQSAIWAVQESNGHWHYPLDDSVTMNAEYIFFLRWMGLSEDQLVQKLGRFLLDQQQDDGSWALFYGGKGHLSSTIESYLALRLAGFSKDDRQLVKAAQFIRTEGGPPKARVFTKIWMALFELHPWDGVPMIPPEIMLSPRGTPFNIYEFSYWSRSVIIPLTILFHHKRTAPIDFDLDELYPTSESKLDLSYTSVLPVDESWFHKAHQWSLQWVRWEQIFHGLNRGFNVYETNFSVKPMRQISLAKARAWILDHQDESGDWGGIMPAIMNSVMALSASGMTTNEEPIQKGLAALKRLTRGISPSVRPHSSESPQSATLQSCVSPIWDTALASLALLDSGVPPTDPRLQQAKDWLWSQRITKKGDWAIKAKSQKEGQTAAWCFQYHNDFYPDLDDTAMVTLVLHKLGMTTKELQPALNFIFSMQNRDGGWGTFDRENNQWILNEIPFADLRSLIDPSNPDVTGHILECLGQLGLSRRPEAKRGVEYLKAFQRPAGSWYGRWGVNLLYGTCAAVVGLRAVGENPEQDYLRRAIEFILSQQNEDGGWGEACDNYQPNVQQAKGRSTPSQTAWALMTLEACLTNGPDHSAAVLKALKFLESRKKEDGLFEPEFTATGFPLHFYLRYDGYRNFFPLIALGRLTKHF